MLVWAFSAHHNGLADREFALFMLHLVFAVFLAAFLWLLYVALEPFVRKKWPGWIISWSRLLAGDYFRSWQNCAELDRKGNTSSAYSRYCHTRYTSVLQSLRLTTLSRAFSSIHLRISVASVCRCVAE
jgi:hypothetical protein